MASSGPQELDAPIHQSGSPFRRYRPPGDLNGRREARRNLERPLFRQPGGFPPPFSPFRRYPSPLKPRGLADGRRAWAVAAEDAGVLRSGTAESPIKGQNQPQRLGSAISAAVVHPRYKPVLPGLLQKGPTLSPAASEYDQEQLRQKTANNTATGTVTTRQYLEICSENQFV